MRLKDRVAIVTGGGAGIGRSVCVNMVKAGAKVVVADINQEAAQETADSLTKEGGDTMAFQMDVTQKTAVQTMAAEALKAYGKIDILVNNAGVQQVAPVEDFPVAEWDRIIALNLSAVFHTTRVALPLMRKAGWGRIINIGSAHSLTASPNKAAYVAAKHGVAGLTKTVALETAEDGITANVICPAWVLTPLVEAQIPDQMKIHGLDRESVIRDVMLARQPTKKFIHPNQIGGVAVFLCSDAADQITGATLTVDGGWTAW